MCADSGHIVIFVQCSSVHLHRCTYGCLKQFSLSAILEVNQKHDFFSYSRFCGFQIYARKCFIRSYIFKELEISIAAHMRET